MRTQIDTLTSLRFFAAFSVVIYHFRESFGPNLDLGIAENFISRGYIWVDFFFLLSGFIIAYVYQEKFVQASLKVYGKFLINRIARLYPAHIFVVGLFLVWETLTYWLVHFFGFSALPFDGCMDLESFITNLFMVHNWGGIFGNCSWNYPAWSISSEWLVYLLFPIILFGLKVAQNGVSAFCSGTILYLVYLIIVLDDDLSLQTASSAIRILMEFTIGILLYRIYLSVCTRISSQISQILCLGAITGSVIGLHFGLSDGLVLPFLAGIILFAALSKSGIVIRVLSFRWLVFLGEASYSVYLIHAFDQRVWNSIVVRLFNNSFSSGEAILAFVTVMAGIVVSGVLLYTFIEKPGRYWVRKTMVKSYE